VRDVTTMSGSHNHCEILLRDLRCRRQHARRRGQGTCSVSTGSARPASRTACAGSARPRSRWTSWSSVPWRATARLVPRREAGHPVAHRRLGYGDVPVQADGAARRVQDRARPGLQLRGVDGEALRRQLAVAHHRPAIQVHGALGYSEDTPLAGMLKQARWARFADGADEIHQMRIAQRTIAAYKDHGSTTKATGDLPSEARDSREPPDDLWSAAVRNPPDRDRGPLALVAVRLRRARRTHPLGAR